MRPKKAIAQRKAIAELVADSEKVAEVIARLKELMKSPGGPRDHHIYALFAAWKHEYEKHSWFAEGLEGELRDQVLEMLSERWKVIQDLWDRAGPVLRRGGGDAAA